MLASSRVFGSLLVTGPQSLPKRLVRNASSWKIIASAVVERQPKIVKQFNVLEKAYLETLYELEHEGSLLCDHELRAREEKNVSKDQKNKVSGAGLRVQLVEDLVKEYKAELAEFHEKYLKKCSEPGVKMDDINRHIDHSLTLLVLQTIGNKQHWLFPQAEHVEGESLRQTAERAISEYFGEDAKAQSLGNAPVAFYKYKFPRDVQKETGKDGAKVFFMRMQYQSGPFKLNVERGSELAWATHDEMLERLPAVVKKAVKPAFFMPSKPDFTPFLDTIAEKEEFRKRHILVE